MKTKIQFLKFALVCACLTLMASCTRPNAPRYATHYGSPPPGDFSGEGDGTGPRRYATHGGGHHSSGHQASRSSSKRKIQHGRAGGWMVHKDENGVVDKVIWLDGKEGPPDEVDGDPVTRHSATSMEAGELKALIRESLAKAGK